MILKQTIEIEVYPHDLDGRYEWEEAVEACEKLEGGWRLPTIDELKLMWYRRADVGSITSAYYWSSSESAANSAWRLYFYYGHKSNSNKAGTNRVRPVRDVKQNEEEK